MMGSDLTLEGVMPIADHQRTKGKKLMYVVEYNVKGYAIRRDGDPLKREVGPVLLGRSLTDADRESAHLALAISDIEGLVGMEE